MSTDELSTTFAALADPTRRAILDRLRHGEASVAELAEPFELTVRAVSKHVGVLEAAGLITRTRDRQRRLSRLEGRPLAQVEAWLEEYRPVWQDRFDNLAQHLEGTTDDTT